MKDGLIRAKTLSSLSSYYISSMLLAISWFSLKPLKDECIGKPNQQKIKHYLAHFIQEAQMNTGNLIIKINKNLH